jgi:tRNA-2-methylthio-N6-dimethylallyladenosine synthase
MTIEVTPQNLSRAGSFHIWTVGCQMNKADSERMGAALEQLGLQETPQAKSADVIVLNSCVVRQNAEDRVVGMLTSLKPWKQEHPERTLALMGCMVGPKQDELRRRFPYVDVFMQPQRFEPLVRHVGDQLGVDTDGCAGPLVPGHPQVATYVPIIHGCDKFCTFCIIPYRRGREVSRPIEELVAECHMLAARGVREVTLLGQNVDSYGHDLPPSDRSDLIGLRQTGDRPGPPDLADLLEAIHEAVPELWRLRFLTSHPNDMSDRIIQAVGRLPRVVEQINLPFQAGDDTVLSNMRRGYTNAQYRDLVARIRDSIPGVALSTDLIVGFPGETDEQFERSLGMVRDIRFDKVHVAAYSSRPNTIADRKLPDDVPAEEKRRRLQAVEEFQERIASEIGSTYLGQTVEVLVDSHQHGKWRGRTRTDKLVFIEDQGNLMGELVRVRIARTSPWSLQGRLVEAKTPYLAP